MLLFYPQRVLNHVIHLQGQDVLAELKGDVVKYPHVTLIHEALLWHSLCFLPRSGIRYSKEKMGLIIVYIN